MFGIAQSTQTTSYAWIMTYENDRDLGKKSLYLYYICIKECRHRAVLSNTFTQCHLTTAISIIFCLFVELFE